MKSGRRGRPRSEFSNRSYIALADLNLEFDMGEVELIREMWIEGFSILSMAPKCNRDCDEVGLLLMDLARNGQISKRPGGIFGTKRGDYPCNVILSGERYRVLDDLDFGWDPLQVEIVVQMWSQGYSIFSIMKKVKRECDEVGVLLIDLGRKGRIKPRKNRIYGTEGEDRNENYSHGGVQAHSDDGKMSALWRFPQPQSGSWNPV